VVLFKKNDFFPTQKTKMVVSFGSSGSRPFTLPDRLLTSLGIPFGCVKTDMAQRLLNYHVPRDLCASRDFRKEKKTSTSTR
jgi:hypothetical protein